MAGTYIEQESFTLNSAKHGVTLTSKTLGKRFETRQEFTEK